MINKQTTFLPFHQPMTNEEELAEVIDSIRSGWITTGPKAKRFESDFAEYVGSKHAIAVNSCTAALHLALEAVGIKEGDEVITSPMTFAATAEVIRYFRAKPVFIDIDPFTMNIDPEKIEKYLYSIKRPESETSHSTPHSVRQRTHHLPPNSSLLTPHRSVKAIIPVHFGGYPCDMDRILSLAEKYDLKIVEDAAHVLPAYYRGRPVGSIGHITCFSFYATKNITTGEGGMITTDNEEWAERMRIMSLHGISKDAWKRYTAEGSWYYEIIAPGYKYNMTDIAAAMGLVQLQKAEKFWQRRIQIAEMYTETFSKLPEIETPDTFNHVPGAGTKHSWHLYVIKLNLERLTIDRNRFIEELKGRGIGTSVHFIPLHIHPYYRETYGYQPDDFPIAFGTYQRIISLPIYPKMTDGEVERVIDAISEVCRMFKR